MTVRVEICKKIIKDQLAGDKVADSAFQSFTMSVYCFPDPTQGKQAMIISAIGYSENQTSEYFIRTDLEKSRLLESVLRVRKRWVFEVQNLASYLLVGDMLENKVADVLSMKGKTGKAVGTVRT